MCHPEFGTVVAAAAASGAVYVWRISSAAGQHTEELQAQLRHARRPVAALSFAPKQHGLVLAAAGALLRRLGVAHGSRWRAAPPWARAWRSKAARPARGVPLPLLLTARSHLLPPGEDGAVRLYSATSLASPCSWNLAAQFACKGSAAISQLCWRPSAAASPATLAVGTGSSITLWELDAGERRRDLLLGPHQALGLPPRRCLASSAAAAPALPSSCRRHAPLLRPRSCSGGGAQHVLAPQARRSAAAAQHATAGARSRASPWPGR
jgi:hypothetical protein